MSNVRILKTVDEVIAAFEGLAGLAGFLGVGTSAVCNMRARGYIPPGWHFRLEEWGAKHGFRFSPSVFGADEKLRPRRSLPQLAHA